MEFANYLPIWDKLTREQQERISDNIEFRKVKKGTHIHDSSAECLGLVLVRTGQLRAYINSEEGREVTVYRLFERDVCLFSASCVMNSIQFDITISAEKETEFWIVPPHIYKHLVENSVVMANYVNELMAMHFTDIMWLMEQIMWKSMDKRLAAFLLEESRLEETPVLKITHEIIASHLGTAREVVTRMLKYFQTEGLVKLTRGAVELLDQQRLQALQ